MERMTAEQYKVRKTGRPSKWKNQPTEYNGIRYDSKKEAAYARRLDAMQRSSEIVSWIRQVKFDLPGGAKHYVDFMLIETFVVFSEENRPDSKAKPVVRFVEVKGRDLPMGKLKRQQVEELYGIEIEIV